MRVPCLYINYRPEREFTLEFVGIDGQITYSFPQIYDTYLVAEELVCTLREQIADGKPSTLGNHPPIADVLPGVAGIACSTVVEFYCLRMYLSTFIDSGQQAAIRLRAFGRNSLLMDECISLSLAEEFVLEAEAALKEIFDRIEPTYTHRHSIHFYWDSDLAQPKGVQSSVGQMIPSTNIGLVFEESEQEMRIDRDGLSLVLPLRWDEECFAFVKALANLISTAGSPELEWLLEKPRPRGGSFLVSLSANLRHGNFEVEFEGPPSPKFPYVALMVSHLEQDFNSGDRWTGPRVYLTLGEAADLAAAWRQKLEKAEAALRTGSETSINSG